MAPVVGFAFLWLSVTAVGKRVFLLVVAAIPNAMLCMTTTAGMVQKAAFGRSKRPPLAEKKQLIIGPSLTLPKGWEFIPVVFKDVMVTLLFLKKAGMGPLFWLFSFPLGKVRMGLVVDGTHPWQLCRSCDFIAQGLGAQRLYPGYIYKWFSYSVRVAISRRRYSQSDIIRLPIPAHHPAAGNAYG